jgi:hypothetical protein
MELVGKLFGEAWEHRRKRRRGVAAGVIVVAAAAAAGLLVDSLDHSPARPPNQPIGAGYHFESYSRVVARTPLVVFSPDQQLGAHCAVLNSIACDSVVVAFELRSPATSVVASIDGRVIKLHSVTKATRLGGKSTLSFRPGLVFSGNLKPRASARIYPQPASEMSNVRRPTFASVRLLINSAADGSQVVTQLWVRAARIWGTQ